MLIGDQLMSRAEATKYYLQELKNGRKYYREALKRGHYPYPLVLDNVLDESTIISREDLGVIDIPTELIIGTKVLGRANALTYNFRPLLDFDTEFAYKWISLCDAHLSDTGITEPILCYEYLGKFYVMEGNKRVSVFKCFNAPTISGKVIRLVPKYSEDDDIKLYYEFMAFYKITGVYGINFRYFDQYARLLAALGTDYEKEWDQRQRKSFSVGFAFFKEAYDSLNKHDGVTVGEALLAFLKVFKFSDLKDLTVPQLARKLDSMWSDILANEDESTIKISKDPEHNNAGIINTITKILPFTHNDHVDVAFIYSHSPANNDWAKAHDDGRKALQKAFGDHVRIKTYNCRSKDYRSVIEKAISEGFSVIFATSSEMINACRAAAIEHRNINILNCALASKYAGVRLYYARIYETKFVAGAIAGMMSENDKIGYIANYPIVGSTADINAFALGVKMTNPRAKIHLIWQSVSSNPFDELHKIGCSVISGRVATQSTSKSNIEYGTFHFSKDGEITPLVIPTWNWGIFYEHVIRSILNNTWYNGPNDPNIWWGLNSGLVDIKLSNKLDDGANRLAKMLIDGVSYGQIKPFMTRIVDQNGVERNDGNRDFSVSEIMYMNFLLDNVIGNIPELNDTRPEYEEMLRAIGLNRQKMSPKKEKEQL